MSGKKLYKSKDKRISGVCGGIAEYLGADPNIVRLVFACTAIASGFGLAAYIVAAVIMPDAPENAVDNAGGTVVDDSDPDVIKGFDPDKC